MLEGKTLTVWGKCWCGGSLGPRPSRDHWKLELRSQSKGAFSAREKKNFTMSYDLNYNSPWIMALWGLYPVSCSVLPLLQHAFSFHSPPFSYIRQSVSFAVCFHFAFLVFIPPHLLQPSPSSPLHLSFSTFWLLDSSWSWGWLLKIRERAWHPLASFPAGKGEHLFPDLGCGCYCCRARREGPAALAEPNS